MEAMTMTAPAQRSVNPLLARAMQASAPAKAKKGQTPHLAISEARELTEAFPLLVQRLKDAEARKEECAAGIIALAEPHRQVLSCQYGECLSSICVNEGVLYVQTPPHFSTKITGPRIAEVMDMCGDRFEKYFSIHCELKGPLADHVRMILDSAKIPYEICIKPTRALHDDRTLDEMARALELPDVKPIRYVRVK